MTNDTPPPPARERTTASLHALTTPTTREALEVWATRRGMTVSAAVRALVEDALWREVRGEPLGPLYGDLPADQARRIVAQSTESEPPGQA